MHGHRNLKVIIIIIIIIIMSVTELGHLLTRSGLTCQIITDYSLTISAQDTKSVAFKGRDPVRTETVIDNKIIEKVNSFSYLGNMISYEMYCSRNIVRVIKSRRMRWAGHVARMGEERGVYRFLVGKQEGKRPLGRTRYRWVDNIRMDLQEEGCGYMDWIGLAQDRDRWRKLVSAVMNLPVP